MKITAIGVGQCGCNLADHFYHINHYANSFFGRGIEILTDAFAVNTDETDLSSLRCIPSDKRHRMVIGTARTFGHGVGKINADGARIMKEAYGAVTDNILDSRKFHEADAVVVIASGAGGTGSGGIGWLIKGLKERIEKPVYAIVVLPFAYEEKGESSYAIINTATCLKTVNQHADAVFLLDNERFGRADVGISDNFIEMNKALVRNFYDLFCAGEEKNIRHIGSKVVDAGDIKQTIEGVGTIGRGEIALSTFYSWRKNDFREAAKEGVNAAAALNLALNNLSLKVNIEDARKMLILVTAPLDIINLNVLEELTSLLQEKSPKAVIRIGDYPQRGKAISVTLVVSKLIGVSRMENLFLRAEQQLRRREELEEEAEERIRQMHRTSANIPSLT